MGVLNGQDADQDTFNGAFLDKNQDTATAYKIDLNNADAPSGGSLTNTQRNINALASALGISTNQVYNFLITWTNQNLGSSPSSSKDKIESIDAAFDGSTGHSHDGTDGEGSQISALDLTDVQLRGYITQGVDYVGASGTSDDVSTDFTGYSPSTNSTTEGVVVNTPYNRVAITDASDGDFFEDGSGNEVYGRITEAAGVWTISYFSLVSGTETAYSFSGSPTLRYYFQQLKKVISTTTPVYDPAFFVPSANATADVITATTSLHGKTILSSSAPPVVSTSGSAGTANGTVANADHTHEGQVKVQFQDEGSNLGTSGTVTEVDFVGAGVSAARVSNKVTVTVGASGGGGGSLQWVEDSNAPIAENPASSNGFNRVYLFQSGLGQALYAAIKVPSSYTAGTQCFMYLPFFSPDTSGTALLQTVTTLIRSGVDAITNTTNQRTSTNSAVTLSAGTANEPQIITLDLSDSSGQINSVAISANDLLLVKLTRGTDTATSDLSALVYAAEGKTS